MDDQLKFWVMDATADDWESLEQILPVVERYYRRSSPEEVSAEIMRLLSSGLFEAMPEPPSSVEQIIATPAEYWFRMTSRGRAAWETESVKFANGIRPE